MKLYEGMFVIDAGRAAREWEGTLGGINSVLEKHGASIRTGWRFDERKLAYPIQGSRRGVYLLQYFDADPEAIAEMRVDLNRSEDTLRYLILRVEGDEEPESPTLGTATPVPADTAMVAHEHEDEDEPVADDDEDEDDEDEDEDEDLDDDDEETDVVETPAEEPVTEEKPADDGAVATEEEATEKKEEA